jgi:type IV secretion system protein VirB8
MNKHSREALDAYYAEAASWNRDRVQSMRTAHRIAWGIAAAAALVAVLEAVALVLLTPLKTVQPYTLMVDKTTGYVQALKPLDQPTITPDAALTQSFLVQYVIAREGFDAATLNADYRKVALFSADAARNSYLTQMQVSNPQSPLILYPRTTVVDARVKSVSPLGANAALVRFDTLREDKGAEPRPVGSWVAVIRYRYSPAPMRLEDRFVNPLGFQVTSYRKDPEALPAVAADTQPTATSAQAPIETAPAAAPTQSSGSPGGYYPPPRAVPSGPAR